MAWFEGLLPMSRRTEGVAGARKGTDPSSMAFSGGCVPARRGGTCQGDTANGTRSTGGSGAGATPGSGRLFQSHSPRSRLTAATTASTAPRSAPMFRWRAGKGGLVDELLAARGAGSPVSFTAWLMPEDGQELVEDRK